MVTSPVAETDGLECLLGQSMPLLAADAVTVVEQREFNVIQRARTGEQIEALENEADLPITDLRQSVLRQRGDVMPV